MSKRILFFFPTLNTCLQRVNQAAVAWMRGQAPGRSNKHKAVAALLVKFINTNFQL
jgi:hypothetical protein